MKPGWRVLSAEWISASSNVASRLTINAGTPVYRLRRLRLANDEPIGYLIAHVTPALASIIDENRLEQGGSLDYLRGTGELAESYANRTIEAILASEETAKLLEIVKGSPLLMIRRRVFNPEGIPIEDLRAMYRGDRFRYHVRQQPES
jgi:GntR family transcriptional regulator